MKSITQMNKDELEKLHEQFNLELPDGNYTKKELLFNLEENNITNESLKKFSQKSEDEKINVEPKVGGVKDGSVVVVMRRKNKLFSYDQYTFSDDRPYVVMTEADADNLIKSVQGFKRASVEEIKRFYNL